MYLKEEESVTSKSESRLTDLPGISKRATSVLLVAVMVIIAPALSWFMETLVNTDCDGDGAGLSLATSATGVISLCGCGPQNFPISKLSKFLEE